MTTTQQINEQKRAPRVVGKKVEMTDEKAPAKKKKPGAMAEKLASLRIKC